MRCFGLALVFLTAVGLQGAFAGTSGCTPAQKAAINHNAKDPTRPGVIGGCGSNPAQVEQFKLNQNRLKNENIIKSVPRLNSGNNL